MKNVLSGGSGGDKIGGTASGLRDQGVSIVNWILGKQMTTEQNKKLYHYTTPEGLIGILSKKYIWATDIFYVNDSEEFMRGINIARQIIEELYFGMQGDQRNRIEHLRKHLSFISPSQNHIPTYISSFSEEGDQLSQWRAYCRGGGFAIGFAKDLLNEVAETQNFELNKCIYEPTRHKEVIQGIVNTILPWIENPEHFMKNKPCVSESDVGSGITNQFIWELHIICSILKNSSFAEEKEWRLVTKTRTDWHKQRQFRSRKGLIIPYIQIKLPEADDRNFWNSIEIIVGPSLYPSEARKSIKQLFRKYYDFEVVTRITGSSYREL